MTTSLDTLIATLSESAADDSEWNELCRTELAALRNPSTAALTYLEQLSTYNRASLFDSSHDTATHYKWLLHRNRQRHFALWLHQYKDIDARGAGYAQVPHDHRYDIASLLLAGKYTAADWRISNDSIRQTNTRVFRCGDVMTMTNDRIHSLLSIEPNTMTLVVEGKRIRGFSTAYYPPDYRPRIFPDFQARWPELQARLGAQ